MEESGRFRECYRHRDNMELLLVSYQHINSDDDISGLRGTAARETMQRTPLLG